EIVAGRPVVGIDLERRAVGLLRLAVAAEEVEGDAAAVERPQLPLVGREGGAELGQRLVGLALGEIDTAETQMGLAAAGGELEDLAERLRRVVEAAGGEQRLAKTELHSRILGARGRRVLIETDGGRIVAALLRRSGKAHRAVGLERDGIVLVERGGGAAG